MSYQIRAAERRDVPALLALADEQAQARRALDERLPSAGQTVPFMSHAGSLPDTLGAYHHATFVAERGGEVAGGISLHSVTQHDDDEFASYYPRRFSALGMLAARPGDGDALAPLLVRAARQATQWQTPSLLLQHPSADRAAADALRVRGFRTYYHYAMRPPAPAFAADCAEGVQVRPALPADLDEAVRIGIESVHFHAACEPTMQPARGEPRKMRARFEAILHEPGSAALLVAARAGRVIGFYSIYTQQIDETWSPPLFAPGRYGLIAEVAVDTRERGRGVGHQLFGTADAWFRERGVGATWLIYLPHNPLSSRFWSSLGFAPVWDVLLWERAQGRPQ